MQVLLLQSTLSLRRALERRSFQPATERRLAVRTYLLSTHWDAATVAETRKVLNEIRECRQGRAATLVTVAREPSVTRVLPRGNWQDESGEIVQPAVPHFLPQISNPEGRRLTRLDLDGQPRPLLADVGRGLDATQRRRFALSHPNQLQFQPAVYPGRIVI